jgi:hypothetical protein
MSVRLIMIVAALTVTSSALAEPAKPQSAQSNPPRRPPAELVLASAETAQAPAPDASEQTPAPVKHRAARVTTCRCGDPQPSNQ